MSAKLYDFSLAFDNYLTEFLSDNVLNELQNTTEWWGFEEQLAKVYLAILRPFLRDCHLNRDLGFDLSSAREVAVADEGICLGALNFRGLFRRNGRETLLEPCNGYLPRTSAIDRHESLHETYLQMVGKADSINQLFLSATSLHSLGIEYSGQRAASCISRSDDKLHAILKICKGLEAKLASPQIREQWTSTIRDWLADPQNEAGFEGSIDEYLQTHDVRGLRDKVDQLQSKNSVEIIRRNAKLFEQWLSLPHRDQPRRMRQAGDLFETWIQSLGWLLFYCRPEHAGSYFYTVRLPCLLPDKQGVLPDSSLSIVGKSRPDETILSVFLNLHTILSSNKRFLRVLEIAKGKFRKFEKGRIGSLASTGDNNDLASVLSRLKGHLAFDQKKVTFILKMARYLVGQKHEGHTLSFCFIFGFSRERIDAESGGMMQEVPGDLQKRWGRFREAFNVQSDAASVGDAMNRWIKSNDLQMQRQDTALFFEEVANEPLPTPTSLVRLRYESMGEFHAVGTEIQLRDALRDLTEKSRTTLGVIVAASGLLVFIDGKCMLLPCNNRTHWDEPLTVLLWGDEPIETEIKAFLTSTLSEIFGTGRVSDGTVMETTGVLHRLCETLVALGHGALIVVRLKCNDGGSYLTPLNPVWGLRDSASESDLRNDCTTYALMAALDGATEILLPQDANDRAILFKCRRFAQTNTPLWKDTLEGLAGEATVHDTTLVPPLSLVGKGTRHHSALALSMQLGGALVITVSADGPVTFWRNGSLIQAPVELRYAP